MRKNNNQFLRRTVTIPNPALLSTSYLKQYCLSSGHGLCLGDGVDLGLEITSWYSTNPFIPSCLTEDFEYESKALGTYSCVVLSGANPGFIRHQFQALLFVLGFWSWSCLGHCTEAVMAVRGPAGAWMIGSWMLYALICAAGTVGNGLVIYVVLRFIDLPNWQITIRILWSKNAHPSFSYDCVP